MPLDVDYKIMLTFLEFYETLFGFLNFKLYESINLKYQPIIDPRLKALATDEEETRAYKSLFQNKMFFLGREVPWSNERPLENKELNATIDTWFTLWQD
nr:pescadillo homolog [Tanacetum cinerariifolium]